MQKRFTLRKLLAVTALSSLLIACGNDDAPNVTASDKTFDSRFVTIATGGASGPYNIIATTLAELYVQDYGVNSKTQTTGASVEKAKLKWLF